MFRVFICLGCLFLVTGCAGSAYHLPKFTSDEVSSVQKELAENTKPLKIYNRSDAQNRNLIANVAGRLKKAAGPVCEQSGYTKCHFEVVYDPDSTVNAYASDGYKITIFKGLLQYLKNNDEVAAVVAHEMGHHLANHNEETRQNAETGAVVAGVLTAVLFAAANANNPNYTAYQQHQTQQAVESMMVAGAHIGVLSYSKEQEREADLLAAYLLARAGYNLEKAQNVMVVLSQFSGEKDPSHKAFLSTHPAGAERVVSWQKAVEEIKSNQSKLPYLKSPEH